jgi:TRL-like protein family
MTRHNMHVIGLLLATIFLGGCASIVDSPAKGAVFAWVEGPINATSSAQNTRMGESCAYSILGLVAFGNASIHGAKNAGGIKEVSSVDHESINILGVFGSYCTVVRGN